MSLPQSLLLAEYVVQLGGRVGDAYVAAASISECLQGRERATALQGCAAYTVFLVHACLLGVSAGWIGRHCTDC